jgi:putative flippase GtrA
MLVGAVVAGAVVGLLAVLVDVAGLDPRLGQAIALLAVTPIAFVLFKRWTFRLR